ncbi:MAG: lipoyl synthase [Gracilibacter sp. BRH_c7a]|nr:MAG: lipoyl synthase [Gracilibacter sp. BRH_c7a]
MHQRKPDWLKIRVQNNKNRTEVEELLARLSLHTVCEEADCPNLMECFSRRTATFMVLGRVCSRNCTFCTVEKGSTQPVDSDEPLHVAEAVKELQLKHVVITSVTRDDLPDGGAGHFADIIRKIRELDENVVIEVLIPDFQGKQSSLLKVIEAKPEIINHNIETIPRLYPEVRPMAIYKRSLELLKNVKTVDPQILTKSGIMVGLGETEEEVIESLQDLRNIGCDLLTIGQYLAPSKLHHPVVEYIHPDIFEKYKKVSLEIGFKYVASGPLVRSSYMADKALE